MQSLDRATNADFQSDKPSGTTSKSLIVLNPSLTLNQLLDEHTQSPTTRWSVRLPEQITG